MRQLIVCFALSVVVANGLWGGDTKFSPGHVSFSRMPGRIDHASNCFALAMEWNDFAKAKQILEMHHSVDVNAHFWGHKGTVLHRANVLSKIDMVQFLIKKGININAVNGRGETPLDHFIKKKFISEDDPFVDVLRELGFKRVRELGVVTAGSRAGGGCSGAAPR